MTFSCTWSAFSQTWVVQSHFLHSQCWLTWVSWCNLCRYKYKWDINSLRTEFLNNSLRTELKIKHRRNHKTNKSKIYSVILTAVFWLLTKCIWYQLEKKKFLRSCHDCTTVYHAMIQVFQYFPTWITGKLLLLWCAVRYLDITCCEHVIYILCSLLLSLTCSS